MSAMEKHEQAYTSCAYCPKMCRFACPVSEAAPSEALSTWGKMTSARQVLLEQRAMDEGVAKAVHACTGCGRCTDACKHANEVGEALFAAREKTVEAGVQPKGAASTLATFAQAQNPFGRDLSSIVAQFRSQTPVRYPLFPGCSSLVKHPQLVEDTLFVSQAFGAPMGVSRAAARCCGYPLYAAGAHERFAAHAEATAAQLASVPELTVLDPGCAWTFKVVYPKFGVTLPTRIRTVVEVLAENLGHAPKTAPLDEHVGYHDACHLGRGLGQYDEPRQLLARAVKRVSEAPAHRAQGGCAGGGGLLPRTMPEVSVEVARRQAVELEQHDATAVVSGCPTSTRMFARAGRRAFDLMPLLRRWLESTS